MKRQGDTRHKVSLTVYSPSLPNPRPVATFANKSAARQWVEEWKAEGYKFTYVMIDEHIAEVGTVE